MNDDQLEGHDALLESLKNRNIAGWKVGLTSGNGRNSMGVGFRPFGWILEERHFSSGSSISKAEIADAELENELCFKFNKDLPFGSKRKDILDAIESVAPAFEIIQNRIPKDSSVIDRLSDGLSHWGLVTGTFISLDWPYYDFQDVAVTLNHDHEPMSTVSAMGHIDDHFASIAALSKNLSLLHISKGDLVITGSFTRLPVDKTGNWCGDFGSDLGTVEINIK